MTSHIDGPPVGGWARLAPALIVNDVAASLRFWSDTLGFSLAYRRPEDEFVYLERDGVQVMLYQRCGEYETGAMAAPLGQGAMFQMWFADIEPVLAALSRIAWPLYAAPRDAWYRAGTVERGLRQFLVQDPDGYLLMIYQELGVRP